MCVYKQSVVLGHAITIILIRCTFSQNVYVLNNSYIMIYIYICRMYSTDRTLIGCIFILHPSYTAKETGQTLISV